MSVPGAMALWMKEGEPLKVPFSFFAESASIHQASEFVAQNSMIEREWCHLHPSTGLRSSLSCSVRILALQFLSPFDCTHLVVVDGSLHLLLSPSDAKTVIESAWGEPHLLAGTKNACEQHHGFLEYQIVLCHFALLFFQSDMTVPVGLLMVYAPRTVDVS